MHLTSPKAVVLLSGGLDSATCLAIARSKSYDCYALSFDYGQTIRSELDSAKQLAQKMHANHHVFSLPIGSWGGSALTDSALDVPDYQEKSSIPITYVPARNTVFLAVALSYAEAIGAADIFIGVNSTDHAGYPDTRPEFIDAFQQLIRVATKASVTGSTITIHTPLLYLSKAQTIQLGLSMCVDYSTTVTCYRADAEGLACGNCDSCVLRRQGFESAGVEDPTRYRGSDGC